MDSESYRKVLLYVTSSDRVNYGTSHSGEFRIKFNQGFMNVAEVSLRSASIPKSSWEITEVNKDFKIIYGGVEKTINLKPGTYSNNVFCKMLCGQLAEGAGTASSLWYARVSTENGQLQVMNGRPGTAGVAFTFKFGTGRIHKDLAYIMGFKYEDVTSEKFVAGEGGPEPKDNSSWQYYESTYVAPTFAEDTEIVIAPNYFNGQGSLDNVFVTVPQFVNTDQFSSASEALNRGLMAIIPVTDASVEYDQYTPQVAQVFKYYHPRKLIQFTYIDVIIYGKIGPVYSVLDFNGKETSFMFDLIIKNEV